MKYLFPKGHKINLGRKQSLEERLRRSKIAKKLGFGKWMTGKKLSETTKEKISKNNAHVKYWLGKKQSDEHRKKVSESHKGNKSYLWKGNNIGYRAKHSRIQTKMGKASYCSFDFKHIATRYHWANISGEYKVDDENDWMQLCPKCHARYDRSKRGGINL